MPLRVMGEGGRSPARWIWCCLSAPTESGATLEGCADPKLSQVIWRWMQPSMPEVFPPAASRSVFQVRLVEGLVRSFRYAWPRLVFGLSGTPRYRGIRSFRYTRIRCSSVFQVRLVCAIVRSFRYAWSRLVFGLSGTQRLPERGLRPCRILRIAVNAKRPIMAISSISDPALLWHRSSRGEVSEFAGSMLTVEDFTPALFCALAGVFDGPSGEISTGFQAYLKDRTGWAAEPGRPTEGAYLIDRTSRPARRGGARRRAYLKDRREGLRRPGSGHRWGRRDGAGGVPEEPNPATWHSRAARRRVPERPNFVPE